MGSSHRAPKIAAALIGVYFVAFLAYAIAAERGLTADGPHYFLSILEGRTVVSPEVSRWAANALTQWPLLVALWAGAQDLKLLSYLHSFGLLYLSLVTPALCWLLVPKARKALIVFPLLSLLFGWMASCFAAISQSQVLALWFWPMVFGLIFGRMSERRHAAIVVLLAAPTILLHEGMSYLGLILAAVAWWRVRKEPPGAGRLVWHALIVWFLAGAAVGLYFTLVPINATDRRAFVQGIVKLWFVHQNGRINHPVVVALVGAALLWFCQRVDRPAATTFRLWFPPTALGLGLAGLAPVLLPGTFQPYMQNHARFWVVFVPVPLFLAMIGALSGRLSWAEVLQPTSRWVIAAVAVAQITWQIGATAQWHGYLDTFQAQLADGSGLLPYETSALARRTTATPTLAGLALDWAGPRRAGCSGWTNPSMSIALSPHGRVAAILAAPRDVRWQPFDPRRPEELPRIRGFDYTAYLQALAKQDIGAE